MNNGFKNVSVGDNICIMSYNENSDISDNVEYYY